MTSHAFPTTLTSTTLSPTLEPISLRREEITSNSEQQIVTPEFRDMYWQTQSRPNIKAQHHHQQQDHEGQGFTQQTKLSSPDPPRSRDFRVWEIPSYIGTSPRGTSGTGDAVRVTTTTGKFTTLGFQNEEVTSQLSDAVYNSPANTFTSQLDPNGG